MRRIKSENVKEIIFVKAASNVKINAVCHCGRGATVLREEKQVICVHIRFNSVSSRVLIIIGKCSLSNRQGED